MSAPGSPPSPSDGPKESRSEDVVIIILTMLGLASLAVIGRIWVRLALVSTRLAADDWIILASFAFQIAFAVDVVCQTNYGLGKHVYDLPPDTNFVESLRLFYYGEALYYVTVGLTKIAILFLYLRLAVEKTFRFICWATVAFVMATIVSCVVAGVFQCNPIAFAWDKTIPGGTCFNVTALFYANAGLNILQDVFIYVLPMKMLWEVQIPRKQKIALIIVFVVGGFVCVTGMLRLDSLRTASISKDPTWDNFGSAIWSGIESSVGIVCASLTHFKPLITRYFPSMMGVRSKSSMANTGGSRSNTKLSGYKSRGTNNSFQMLSQDKPNADGRYGVTVTGGSRYGDYSSQENLRDYDVERKPGQGIYKTTTFSAS